MTPLVSILMPAYNHERYVEMAVRSVLDQDWPRIELVVVDDGSGDATWERLLSLEDECRKRLERMHVERQENQGVSVTCNRLVELARGEYVMFLASDDCLLPGAVTALAGALDSDDGCGAVVGENELMDSDGRRCYWTADRKIVYGASQAAYRTFNEFLRTRSGLKVGDPRYGRYEELLCNNHIANGCLIRRRLLAEILPYPSEVVLNDYWQQLQLAKRTRFREIPVTTFRYRWHATNSVKTQSSGRNIVRELLAYEENSVMSSGNRKLRKAFAKQCWHRVRRRSWGPFAVELCETNCGMVKRLRVFGVNFYFAMAGNRRDSEERGLPK